MARQVPGTDKKGRSKSGEQFAKMFRATMETPAWRALTPYARLLYPWLKLEWHGPKNNNNRHIRLSVKQAAKRLGCSTETARKAFHDLQRKGFVVVTHCAVLGTAGEARGHEYELTELGTALSHTPRHLYREWRPEREFDVTMAAANNPTGKGGLGENRNPTHQVGSAQLTRPEGPNSPRKMNGAENGRSPTQGVSHPYIPGGSGGPHFAEATSGCAVRSAAARTTIIPK